MHTLTSTATILLITAVHAVRISITPPADGDTVSVLTLELVVVTLQITPMLQRHHSPQMTEDQLLYLQTDTKHVQFIGIFR